MAQLEDQLTRFESRMQAWETSRLSKLSHPYFRNWGAYTGLALEKDWKQPQRRWQDLAFRAQLMRHYAQK